MECLQPEPEENYDDHFIEFEKLKVATENFSDELKLGAAQYAAANTHTGQCSADRQADRQ